jgi:hypothetical protein
LAVQSVGTTVGSPGRHRASDPRRTRTIVQCALGFLVVAAIVAVGCAPTLRYLGYLPKLGKREATTHWQVLSIASDRRSAVIRIETCAAGVDGVRVTPVGTNVRLTVIERKEPVGDPRLVDCVPFSMMPKRVVQFGFALPDGGRVLASGCPTYVCSPPGQLPASAP